MRNTKILIPLVLIIAIGSFAYLKLKSPLPPSNMVVSSAKLTSQYDNANSMINDTPLVVIGTKGSEQPDFAYDDAGMIDRYGTISEFNINKVIKNETSVDIKDSDKISVLENAAFDKKESQLYSVEGYQLMRENKRYILFLQPNKSTKWPYVGSYEIKGVVYGKFAFGKDRNERDKTDWEESSAYESDIKKDHEKLKVEIASKYEEINQESQD